MHGPAGTASTGQDPNRTALALGDRLETVPVPGGHMVIWDAYDETADAVVAFLENPRP